jgi:hypothetical protein
MDQTVTYADILTSVLRKEAGSHPGLLPTEIVSVCDREAGEFVLLMIGADSEEWVESVLFRARLVDGKVIIETDNIEEGLKLSLIEAGVSPNDIAFAWNLPKPEAKPAAASSAMRN